MDLVPRLDYFSPGGQQYQFQNCCNVDLDEYVYCELCGEDVYEYCTTHGPLLEVPDETPSEEELRCSGLPWAALTLPRDALYIAPSTMPGDALGVFAARDLPARVSFGPYRGYRRAPGSCTPQPYTWAVLDSQQRPVCEVDASDPRHSNWLRYVNCARHRRHQNLLAYQYRRDIYYRTIKPIPKNSELLVYLGSDVAYWLGVHVSSYAYMVTIPMDPHKTGSKAIPTTKDDFASDIDYNATLNQNTTATNEEVDESVLRKKNEKSSKETGINSNEETMAHSEIHSTVNTAKSSRVVKEISKINEKNGNEQVSKHMREYVCVENTNRKGILKNKENDQNVMNNIHTHTGVRPFKCDRCEYSATQKSDLQTHMRTHTGERPFKCDRCEYSATRKSHLQTHMHTHTGERPFKCDRCEFSAIQKSHLQTHMRTHTGERPFKCDGCEYSTTQKSGLQRHMRTHTGERPFKCDRCEYSATRKSHLQTHMRTHTGERPFKCDRCEYSATRKSRLQTHMRTHTGERPFKCDR